MGFNWMWGTDSAKDFLMGKKSKGVQTKEVYDPLKTAVASPLSEWLAQQAGKGVPRYTGDFAPNPIDAYEGQQFGQDAQNRYSEFMNLDAGSWFDKNIGQPETERFKEDLLPTIREGYAGSLRGSGRFSAEEAGINRFAKDLSQKRGEALLSINQAQFGMAAERFKLESGEKYKSFLSSATRWEQMDKSYQREYRDWTKSLPEYNPALQASLGFLSGPTGRDLLTWLDPGEEGMLKYIIKAAGNAAGAMA